MPAAGDDRSGPSDSSAPWRPPAQADRADRALGRSARHATSCLGPGSEPSHATAMPPRRSDTRNPPSLRAANPRRSSAALRPAPRSMTPPTRHAQFISAGSRRGRAQPPRSRLHLKRSAEAPVFAREDASVLQDAADFLRRAVARPRVTILGQVVRLEREGDEPDGTVGIRGRLDDQDEERMVVVPLSPQDYERALRSHDRRLEVSCSGVLERRGTHLRLADPIEFHAPDVLFESAE